MTNLMVHFVLFTVLAILFLIAPIMIGWLVRPRIKRSDEKRAVYECGEPTIGSSYIQFDLRFYVVALLFIIFDVEVAFFFPWATVYAASMQLADESLADSSRAELSARLLDQPAGSVAAQDAVSSSTALTLGWTGLADIAVFFGVLLVGFAYVWKRGDLDWVRAVVESHRARQAEQTGDVARTPEPVA